MQLTPEQMICRVCGHTVYGRIWLDDQPPNGECPNGRQLFPCDAAMDRARLYASLIRDGILKTT